MNKVNRITECCFWKKKINHINSYFKKKLIKLSKISNFKEKNLEFSILLTNNKKMKQLNKKFRKKNKPTDVLSFPINECKKKEKYIGDIALSFEIINNRSKKTSFDYELDRIWVHGYLHLVGYDHKRLKDYKKMLMAEKEILKKLDHKFNLQI